MADNTVNTEEIVDVSTDEIVEPEVNEDDYEFVYDEGSDKLKLIGAGVAGGGIGALITLGAIKFKKWREKRTLENAEKIKAKEKQKKKTDNKTTKKKK